MPMRPKWGCLGIAAAVAAAWTLGVAAAPRLSAAKKEEKMLLHNVFFTLKESTPENVKKLVEACKKHLPNHEGVHYFAAGPRVAECDREVNDKDFHVALTLVFRDKASHDKYQDAEDHKKFIAEAKDWWKTVKVFDSYMEVLEAKGE